MEDNKEVATEPPIQKAKQIHVRVGVGVLVKDADRKTAVFAGIRKGSHGAGLLALPGGHLEMFESWESCAMREVKEEMNLDLDPETVKFGHVTNDIMKNEDKHYVTIFMMAACKADGSSPTVPENMEPHKCEGWKSYTWQELKDVHEKGEPKLFGPLKCLIEEAPDAVQSFLTTQPA
jgi:8-oxo-dGTP diphosphatase